MHLKMAACWTLVAMAENIFCFGVYHAFPDDLITALAKKVKFFPKVVLDFYKELLLLLSGFLLVFRSNGDLEVA